MHLVKAGLKDKQRKAWLLPSKKDSGMYSVRFCLSSCINHYSWTWVLHNWPYAILVPPHQLLGHTKIAWNWKSLFFTCWVYRTIHRSQWSMFQLMSSCRDLDQNAIWSVRLNAKCVISSWYWSLRISFKQIIEISLFTVRKAAGTICDMDAAPSNRSAFICMTKMHVACLFR